MAHDFGEYRDYLMVLAKAMISVDLRTRIDPSDVVQETIYKALCDKPPAHEPRERERPQMIAWLRKILHDRLVDRLRRLQLERQIESLDGGMDQTSERMSILANAGQSAPDARAIREEDAQILATMLSKLSPLQAEAVVLKYCRGISVIEISRHMNRTPDAIGGLLRHGMRRLRELMPREE
jgi:RNA polymerase sigma-70 factor, ECF subfamily